MIIRIRFNYNMQLSIHTLQSLTLISCGKYIKYLPTSTQFLYSVFYALWTLFYLLVVKLNRVFSKLIFRVHIITISIYLSFWDIEFYIIIGCFLLVINRSNTWLAMLILIYRVHMLLWKTYMPPALLFLKGIYTDLSLTHWYMDVIKYNRKT